MNARLVDHPSLYLRQHAGDPTGWRVWGDEAFAEARERNAPILLSVGYASCHWCHVMQHEVFQDAEIAAFVNAHFVPVKVDREERPDADEAYMAAVQLSSGRGGWPMTLFLTPDGRPFFAGTYIPPDRFVPLARGIAEAFAGEERVEIERVAGEFDRALRANFARPAPEPVFRIDQAELDRAVAAVLEEEDPVHGGFGDAPKFPPHGSFELLLALWERGDLAPDAQGSLLRALRTMARSGLHDHVGGGFHRYSTDAEFRLPHFEKTLYDNALLLTTYARAHRLSGDPELRRTVNALLGWFETEMRLDSGLYASALDADSEGEEGTFYTWPLDELPPDVATFFGATEEGNFRDEATGRPIGRNVLHATEPCELDLSPLRRSRRERVRPARDDKALMGWNALLLRGFVAAGAEDQATSLWQALLPHLAQGDQCAHVAGSPSVPAFLEDIAALSLAQADLPEGSLGVDPAISRQIGVALARMIPTTFAEGDLLRNDDGSRPSLFGRTTTVLDAPIPSPVALAVMAMSAHGLDPSAHLRGVMGWMTAAPTAAAALWAATIPHLPLVAVTVRREGGSLVATAPPGYHAEIVRDDGATARVRLCSETSCFAEATVDVAAG